MYQYYSSYLVKPHHLDKDTINNKSWQELLNTRFYYERLVDCCYKYIYIYIHTHTHIYMHIYVYICAYIYIYIYIYIQTFCTQCLCSHIYFFCSHQKQLNGYLKQITFVMFAVHEHVALISSSQSETHLLLCQMYIYKRVLNFNKPNYGGRNQIIT